MGGRTSRCFLLSCSQDLSSHPKRCLAFQNDPEDSQILTYLLGMGHGHMVRVGMEAEIKDAFMMTNRDFFFFMASKENKKTPSGLPTMTPPAPCHGEPTFQSIATGKIQLAA